MCPTYFSGADTSAKSSRATFFCKFADLLTAACLRFHRRERITFAVGHIDLDFPDGMDRRLLQWGLEPACAVWVTLAPQGHRGPRSDRDDCCASPSRVASSVDLARRVVSKIVAVAERALDHRHRILR